MFRMDEEKGKERYRQKQREQAARRKAVLNSISEKRDREGVESLTSKEVEKLTKAENRKRRNNEALRAKRYRQKIEKINLVPIESVMIGKGMGVNLEKSTEVATTLTTFAIQSELIEVKKDLNVAKEEKEELTKKMSELKERIIDSEMKMIEVNKELKAVKEEKEKSKTNRKDSISFF